MAETKKTVSDWVKHLAGAEVLGVPLTLAEFQARCLMDIRDNLIQLNLGIEHLEGMGVNQEAVQTALLSKMGGQPLSGPERLRDIDAWKEDRRQVRGASPAPYVDLSALPPKRD